MKKAITIIVSLALALVAPCALAEEAAKPAISLELIENPSTGYTWACELSVDGVLKIASDEYISDAARGVVGASGVHKWDFDAIGAGEVTITMTLSRAGDAEPARVITYDYRIAEGGVAELMATTAGAAEITLLANASTGYVWRYEISGEGSAFPLSDVYKPLSDELLVGASSLETWHFQGLKAGEVTIKFTYMQPWEGGDGPVKEYSYVYEVGEDGAMTFLYTTAPTADIELEENAASDGYTWMFEIDNPGVVALAGETFAASQSGLDGAPGVRAWRFVALSEGVTTITFRYAREWENTIPKATAVYTVSVDADLNAEVSLATVATQPSAVGE